MLLTPKVVIPDSIHHDKVYDTWRRLGSICVFHNDVNRNKTAAVAARERAGGLVCCDRIQLMHNEVVRLLISIINYWNIPTTTHLQLLCTTKH